MKQSNHIIMSEQITNDKQPTRQVTEEEKQKMAATASAFACKPVLCALISFVEEYVKSPKSKKMLVNRIKNHMVQTVCANLSVELDEQYNERGAIKLHIGLSLVERTYVAAIDLPTLEFKEELFGFYNYVKLLATSYWKAMLAIPDVAKLVHDINAAVDDLPKDENVETNKPQIEQLIIDPLNATTLYFDPRSAKRVGIFPWYTRNGQPIRKNKS